MHNDVPDVVALAVYVIAFVTSMEVAHLLGPYVAIIVSASAGASLSLSMPKKAPLIGWWQPLTYITVRLFVAFVLTGALAEIVYAGVPRIEPRILLILIAFAIGIIPDYFAVVRFIANALRKVLPEWLANIGKRNG